MKYQVGNFDTKGSCLQGYVLTTYDELARLFGPPVFDGDGEKVTAEWVLKFANGEIATIYDWKMEDTPMGLYEWHIGGYNFSVVHLVHNIIGKMK